ncbi:hypothetical protein GCM10022631_24970 [Deinococcus rubellus]|uniref:SOS response-associated peptidase n=1 Tax=Deinococcus rubellus TaxID=1889240 RepID=A0ABY5YHS2_9DEIO|nr:SOS response-associated peptidase [Deinococcus rubellus]UWX63922.1 SOS response-associated peptidase [Deinococcus rubellus]
MSTFYEWPIVDRKKRKTRLGRLDGSPLLVTGLWNRCELKEGMVKFCMLVTRPLICRACTARLMKRAKRP